MSMTRDQDRDKKRRAAEERQKLSAQPTMDMWVITQNPSDFPGQFVARLHRIKAGKVKVTAYHHVRASLDEIRKSLPPGLSCLGRLPDDAPQIVESWL